MSLGKPSLTLGFIGRITSIQVAKMRSKRLPHCPHGPLASYLVSSPIGDLFIQSCPRGLHTIGQIDDITDDSFLPDANKRVVPISGNPSDSAAVQACVRWLQEYFENPGGIEAIPKPELCLTTAENAAFHVKVWKMLASKVTVGQTVSYGELAKLVDNPKAAQAVGGAMRRNPYQLIVPCHRVTRSDSMGLYANGTRNSVKKWLLQHEGAL